MSAFANDIGGIIYFGIDHNQQIVGIEFAQKNIEKISELIKSRIEPILSFKISTEVLEK